MKRIKELQLHNFKFFTDTNDVLKIDNKHLLIWGENGSGKSSIYWAIYTILQCSYKDAIGIDAYFIQSGAKNLVNIHAPVDANSFVKMKLDDDSEYIIAFEADNVQGVKDIQLSAVSSDFINYSVLASFLSFYHRDDPFLFEMFEEEIFRYLEFTPPAPYTFNFFDNAWTELNDKRPKKSAKGFYPNKNSIPRINYSTLKNEFNRQLRTILGITTTKANDLLKNKFGYDIEIELEYEEFDFEITRLNRDIRFTEPQIYLRIRRYYGKEDVVKKPHSFLNEAKKTAIGLAIRLGILERRLLADKLNVLALDDLLISLDMSNREVVLKLLFEEYMSKYQLLIFTHDRQFFNIAKEKIEANYDKKQWGFWEFYVDERGTFEKPRLFENETELSTAQKHLLNNDYPASANYLRKHCEKIIMKYLPEYCYRNIEKKESHVNYPLDSMLTTSLSFLNRINQTTATAKINQLKQYLSILLNPLSHTEQGTERYKGEIKAIMVLLDELESLLKTIKQKRILKTDDFIYLHIQKSATELYKIKLTLKEDLYIYEDAGIAKLSKCNVDSVQYWAFDGRGIEIENKAYRFIQNQELKTAYSSIVTHATVAIPPVTNWETLLSKEDGTILNTLMTF